MIRFIRDWFGSRRRLIVQRDDALVEQIRLELELQHRDQVIERKNEALRVATAEGQRRHRRRRPHGSKARR